MDNDTRNKLRKIPGVDMMLKDPEVIGLISSHGITLITSVVRNVLDKVRSDVIEGKKEYSIPKIYKMIEEDTRSISEPSLKPVINATGIVLHTNLSRAPLGKVSLRKAAPVISGYSNLEFNLKTGKRGQRNDHIKSLITYITGAENAVVVNNNAAAVLLTLLTFAKGKEVIVSRGELIEIGGSFRIPDIMKTSGAKMVEVGSTNRTRLKDYEDAITDKTRILFKAHKSNYEIKGFSEEVETAELAKLAKDHNLIMFYDIGSGLLRKPEGLGLKDEPDVQSSLKDGADLVSFSGDKLLGGPQAGIISGKKELVNKLAKSPLMRALRVGKLTMSTLQHAISAYLDDSRLAQEIPIFEMLNRNAVELKLMAGDLHTELAKFGIKSTVVTSKAQVGGGTLPGLEVDSFGVQIISEKNDRKFAQKVFKKLMELEDPVLGILREGKLIFDLLSIFKEDIPDLASRIAQAMDKK